MMSVKHGMLYDVTIIHWVSKYYQITDNEN